MIDDDQVDQPEGFSSAAPSQRFRESSARLHDPNASPFHKPRVKLVETGSDLTPAGASFHPPTPAPLPERGAGLWLFLSFASAITAVTFAVMIANKL